MSIRTISPVDGSVYAERTAATVAQIEQTLQRACAAQPQWREVPIAERAAIIGRFCGEFERRGAAIATGLSWQMGRPIRFAPSEVRGTLERARYMTGIAPTALADMDPGPKSGFRPLRTARAARRRVYRGRLELPLSDFGQQRGAGIDGRQRRGAEALGTDPAVRGSASPSACRVRACQRGLFQVLHLGHADTERVIRDSRVDFVAFTGSVAGGRAVQRVAAERFIGVGLELGGCDPVYVRHDADLAHAIENIVDGAYFNSGQSCCGLQRIYVHESLYEAFAAGATELIRTYRLGDPRDPQTTLGPMVRSAAADAVRAQIQATIAAGARAALLAEGDFPAKPGRDALSGPAAAARCATPVRRHARGDLRTCGRSCAGALGR